MLVILAQVWMFTTGCSGPDSAPIDTASARDEACAQGTMEGYAWGKQAGAACRVCEFSQCTLPVSRFAELMRACEQNRVEPEADAKTDQGVVCGFVLSVYQDCCADAYADAWTTASSEAGCPVDSAAPCW